MSLWLCRQCTAAYAVGLPACPQCASTDYQEDHMPKISRASGVTYEDGHAPEDAEPKASEPQDEAEAAPKKRAAKKTAAAESA